jgi:hypothetical protein
LSSGYHVCSKCSWLHWAPPDEDKAFERSGNDDLDRALIVELKRIVEILQINPGFKYLNVMNAYSTVKRVVPNTTDGTVYLGLPLIKKLLEQPNGGAAVAGICVHQGAHIYQYKMDIARRLLAGGTSFKFIELHADFLAGYYMGRRVDYTADQIEAFRIATFSFGDYDLSNPQHHGTPYERRAAVNQGYRTALEKNSLREAAVAGLTYVRTL